MTMPERKRSKRRRGLCPVCGKTAGTRLRDPNDPDSERINDLDFEREARPLGYVQEFGGRGSITTAEPFGPDDDPDGFFPRFKGHLLAAVREWHEKGWITDEELASL